MRMSPCMNATRYRYTPAVRQASPGPPDVPPNIAIDSTVALTMPDPRTKTRVKMGLSKGMVMNQNCCHPPAPSTTAAS